MIFPVFQSANSDVVEWTFAVLALSGLGFFTVTENLLL